MTNKETIIKNHYDRMRKLNPDLPEWDDASTELKNQHIKMYDKVIGPTLDKIFEISKRKAEIDQTRKEGS